MFHQVTAFWLDYLVHVNKMWMVEVLRTQIQRALSLYSPLLSAHYTEREKALILAHTFLCKQTNKKDHESDLSFSTHRKNYFIYYHFPKVFAYLFVLFYA